MKQHKWHKEIKAWADGAEIEYRAVPGYGEWKTGKDCVMWVEVAEYRIKPQPKEPQYLYVYKVENKIRIAEPNTYFECKNLNDIYCIGKIKLEVEDE